MKKVENTVSALLLVMLVCIGSQSKSWCQSLTVSGSNWTVPLTYITEAGKDYVNSQESATNQILLSGSGTAFLWIDGTVKISAHYTADPKWNNNLLIAVKRTGNGTLNSGTTISGNTNYINILNGSDLELFTVHNGCGFCTYTFSNTPMQLQLSGISVTVPSDAYSAKIVFTISY
jgi:hypothetical protein